MANGDNGISGQTLKTIGTVVVLISVIIGATITFANKVDRNEMQACTVALEGKIEKGDGILHKRVDKTEEKLLKLIEKNQNEIIGLLKQNHPHE